MAVASCLVAGQFHDFSVDGNAYHKLAVAALADGWNPLRAPVTDWPPYAQIYTFETRAPLWVEHYAQGLWFIQAVLYDLTGQIEQAKATTLIAMYATAALALGFLSRWGVASWKAAGIALLVAVNPITLAQINTFYCDAFLMMALFALLLGLVAIAEPGYARHNSPVRPIPRCEALAVAVCAFILCANTKFTGLAYAGVFTCVFCALYLWRWHRGALGFSTRRTLVLGASFVATLLVSVLFVGHSSYVTNTLDHGNPLYPLFGQDAVDIMTPQEPPAFNDASTPQKLFYATFSQSANISAGSTATPQLKVPLTWTSEELAALTEPDLRLGGFGILYSAAVLLGLPLLVLALVRSRTERPGFFEVALAFLIPAFCLTLALSDSWWARYSPYLYAVNLLTLTYFALPRNPAGQTCASSMAHSSAPNHAAQAAAFAFALLLGANALFSLRFSTLENLERSRVLDTQIAQLAQAVEHDGARLFISYDYMPGLVYTLWDRGLEFDLEPAGVTQGCDPHNTLGALRYRLDPPAATS